MSIKVKSSAHHTISAKGLRTSIRRIEEGDVILRRLREFVESGGKIHWVIDTDVVHLFLNPKSKQRYADIFGAETRSEEQPSLVALAALLADFIFSDRFVAAEYGVESPVAGRVSRLMLEPHVEELDDTIQSIARQVSSAAATARNATSGNLEKRIRDLLNDYVTGKVHKELPNHEFAKKLVREVESSISLILPDGPLSELTRARNLLKERKAFLYQADDEALHARLTGSVLVGRIHELTDKWFEKIRLFARESGAYSADEDESPVRSNEVVRDLRDAEVLAKLEVLNETEQVDKVRYVIISGHEFLHGIIRRNNPGRAHPLYAVRPRDLLGNPRLFELDASDGKVVLNSDHDARWKRITGALKLLGAEFDESNPSLQANIEGLTKEWDSVQRMALPYLPAQSSLPSLREVARMLFEGKAGDALDIWIYMALSEFFVVTAELGLLAHRDAKPPAVKRKAPPLRLAFYPKAELFVCHVIDGAFWGTDNTIDLSRVAAELKHVKDEQRKFCSEKSANFNYPLLLCLAARFAALDDWHASRVLATHAKAVANVLDGTPAFVTGREAALLEAYSRRLEAKCKDDLEIARSALKDFRQKVEQERSDWLNEENRRNYDTHLKLHKFNPEDEFPLHELRADVDEVIIDFTGMMFDCFAGSDHQATTGKLIARIGDFTDLINRVVDCLTRLDELQSLSPGSDNTTLEKIRSYIRTQMELCGLQCAQFVIAGCESEISPAELSRWSRLDLLSRVYDHGTVIAKLAALVGRCIWGTAEQQAQSVKELINLGNGSLLIYDKPRHDYLIKFAERLAAK